MELLNGKQVSDQIKKEISEEVVRRVEAGYKRPHLVAVLVGDDGASITYVESKERACKAVGFDSTLLRLPADISESDLLYEIGKLNQDNDVDGFIVQLPLPKHINEQRIIEAIDPAKDVDGFHPVNVGKMMLGQDTFYPATPYGIVMLLKKYGIETSGKHCVVLGRSNIVGRPMANMLSQKGVDCTVTMCHSKTRNLKELTLQADIIVAAVGVTEFLKGDMVKEGAVVVDVGIARIPAPELPKGYRIVGDVEFSSVAPKCSYITPVPGGVGPMTIVSLLENTLKASAGKK